MINKTELNNLQLVPEDIVQYCADACTDDKENSFRRILDAANEFRNAGLTPVYLCSYTLQDLFVTTRQQIRFESKFHD